MKHQLSARVARELNSAGMQTAPATEISDVIEDLIDQHGPENLTRGAAYDLRDDLTFEYLENHGAIS